MTVMAVTYNHHPTAAIGANNSCVPAVIISVINAYNPRVPLIILPVVIPILGIDRKG
jgi:hypothetical protein